MLFIPSQEMYDPRVYKKIEWVEYCVYPRHFVDMSFNWLANITDTSAAVDDLWAGLSSDIDTETYRIIDEARILGTTYYIAATGP